MPRRLSSCSMYRKICIHVKPWSWPISLLSSWRNQALAPLSAWSGHHPYVVPVQPTARVRTACLQSFSLSYHWFGKHCLLGDSSSTYYLSKPFIARKIPDCGLVSTVAKEATIPSSCTKVNCEPEWFSPAHHFGKAADLKYIRDTEQRPNKKSWAWKMMKDSILKAEKHFQ